MTHTKDEALVFALNALELEEAQTAYPSRMLTNAITAIKQARSAPVQEPVMEYPDYTPGVGWRNVTPPAAPVVQKPVAWKWHQAPVKTSWGHDMVVADLAIDKNNTVSVYCERDQTAKVEAMFTPPAAQPAPVPLTDEKRKQMWRESKPDHASWISFVWYSQGIGDAESHHGITEKGHHDNK